jgi:hypothetical protein
MLPFSEKLHFGNPFSRTQFNSIGCPFPLSSSQLFAPETINHQFVVLSTMPKPLPDGLVVRELTHNDISSLADLLTMAPDDGTPYQFPQVRKYPKNMNQLYIQWLRGSMQDRDGLNRIVVLHQKGGRPKVVGYSCWYRRESDPDAPGSTRCVEWRQATWGESE